MVVALSGAIIVGWCAGVSAGETGVRRLVIEQPRSFGYQIGDKFERIVHLTLGQADRLDTDSLPKQGRISPSLVVDEPEIEERRQRGSIEYDVTLTYQIINVHPEVTDIPVPHHDIQYLNGDEKFQILIPASRIGVSVLRGRTGGPDIQPDQTPLLLQDSTRIVALALVFALSLAVFILLRWGLPFVGGSGPFVRAGRRLKALHGEPWDDERYDTALQLIHQGFDETAGRTVFPEHLNEFFAGHESFETCREPIVEFFTHSRAHFFGSATHPESDHYTYARLTGFVVKLRNIERRLA